VVYSVYKRRRSSNFNVIQEQDISFYIDVVRERIVRKARDELSRYYIQRSLSIILQHCRLSYLKPCQLKTSSSVPDPVLHRSAVLWPEREPHW